MSNLNLLIADDHGIVRSGIKSLMKDHFEFARIDEATSEEEIARQIKLFSYDLLLLDIGMPGSDFVNLMNWLKQVTPETKIIIVSTFPENIYAERCLLLGAKGFINKMATNSEIVVAVKRVLDSGIYFRNGTPKAISQLKTSEIAVNPFNKLSARELEIAILINDGHSMPSICSMLNIQYSTANTHKRRLFEKLNVRNVATLSNLMHTFRVIR